MTNVGLSNNQAQERAVEFDSNGMNCWPCFARLHVFGGVFLFLLLNITFKYSHDYTASLLVLGSWVFFVRAAYDSGLQVSMPNDKKWLLVVLVMYLLVSMLPLLAWEGSVRSLETESKILLIIPVIFLLHRFPPPFKLARLGIFLGAIALGLSAAYEIHELGHSRPGGHAQLIQYGAIAMTIGLMGLALAPSVQHKGWRVLAYLAACAALYASFVNGSRGAWVVLPVALVVLYMQLITLTSLPRWKTLFVLMGFVALAVAVLLNTNSTAKQRIDRAQSDVEQYFSGGNKATSVGLRFEMWKAAWEAGKRYPWIGYGNIGYEKTKAELIEKQLVIKQVKHFGHAHNGFFDAWAKGGLLKLISLLALVFYPVGLGWKYIRKENKQTKVLGYSLVMLGISIAGINLSQGFFSHNIGMIFYLMILAIFTSFHVETEESPVAHS